MVPDATVTLKSTDTGATQTATTNASGAYRFTLVKPGHFTVTASLTGFQKTERAVEVSVGQLITADLTLEVGSSTQTVEVYGRRRW